MKPIWSIGACTKSANYTVVALMFHHQYQVVIAKEGSWLCKLRRHPSCSVMSSWSTKSEMYHRSLFNTHEAAFQQFFVVISRNKFLRCFAIYHDAFLPPHVFLTNISPDYNLGGLFFQNQYSANPFSVDQRTLLPGF